MNECVECGRETHAETHCYQCFIKSSDVALFDQ